LREQRSRPQHGSAGGCAEGGFDGISSVHDVDGIFIEAENWLAATDPANTLFLAQRCLMGIAGNMELRHVRYFATVAELLNFTKAAAKLRVAQPALSRQIHDLEEELGVPLFERNSRFVRLTDAGKAFLTDACELLRRADAAAQTARAFATGERGEIQIGYAPSLTVEVLPLALRAFERQCPRVRVSLHDLSVQEMLQSLRDGRLDAALTVASSAKHMRGLAFAKLRDYSVCVAVSRAHRLARAKRVQLAAIKDERLVVYTRAEYPEYHEWLNAILDGAIRNALESGEEHGNGTSLIAAVEAGRGIAVVPSVVASVAGARLAFREIQPRPEPLVVGLACPRRRLSPAALRFVTVVSALAE
jgi:DNA-binding transcriptional LysR family regulator